MHVSKHANRLKNCRSGATIIEFAIVAPVLFLFLVGFIELGLIFFTTSVLEGATNIGSRIGKTGYTDAGVAREDFIRSEIVRLSGGFLDPAQLDISILSYSNFDTIGQEEHYDDANGNGQHDPGETFTDVNGNGQWDRDQGAANAGGRGAVVLYRVSYPWHVFTPLMRSFIADGSGILMINAIASVKNEQF